MLIIALIIAICFILSKVADKLINVLNRSSHLFKLSEYQVTALILTTTTTLPEMAVSTISAASGVGDLAIGNAIGSNIVNLSLVLGMAAIAGGSLHFNSEEKLKSGLSNLWYTAAPFVFLIDGLVSRFEGMMLLFIYMFYIRRIFTKKSQGTVVESLITSSQKKRHSVKLLGEIIFWAILMIGCSQLVVTLSQNLANHFRLPMILVGLFVVSVGTSLPELVFNIETARKKKVYMNLGSVVGSSVNNSTLIIGLSALINPIRISNSHSLILAITEFIFLVMLLIFFIKSKHRLDWWEGLILVGIFFYYSIIEII